MVWALAGDEAARIATFLNRPRRDVAARWVSPTVVALLLIGFFVLTAVGFRSSYGWNNPSADGYFANWQNPEAPTYHVIDELELHGIHFGYADYWVAYDLDCLSHGNLSITTIAPDPDREVQLNAAVVHTKNPAWLFTARKEDTVAWWQFGATQSVQGPGGDLTESQFLQYLRGSGIHYRVIQAGIIDAVVPHRPVRAPPSY